MRAAGSSRRGGRTSEPASCCGIRCTRGSLHWSVAAFFILALLSGFAIYSPWLYRWLTPLFGGGPMTRLLHPWFSIAFVAIFVLQFINWLRPMSWTRDDSRWMRRLKSYVTNTEKLEPEYVDFFNAGQKLYFWAIAATAVDLPGDRHPDVVPGDLRTDRGGRRATCCTTSPRSSCWWGSSSTSTKAPPASPAPSTR